jgi:ribonuclease HII
MLCYERKYLDMGYRYICGVDEVGRGPLAGPVCVTAIICDLGNIVDGVNDSKKLSSKKREKLYPEIIKCCHSYKTVFVANDTIDQINILEATKLAMKTAISELSIKPDFVLVDALKLGIDIPTEGIIGGDAKSYSIASASIIAKVERDKYMTEIAKIYPQYGFDKNMGYGTAHHIEALKKYGATPIHRKTFIRNFIDE